MEQFISLFVFVFIAVLLLRTFSANVFSTNPPQKNNLYTTVKFIDDKLYLKMVFLILILIFIVLASLFLIFSNFNIVSKLIMLAGAAGFVIIFLIEKD